MATLTSGDTLSLNALKTATGATNAKMSEASGGNTTSAIQMSSFAIDSVGDISGYTYLPENNSDTYTLGFGGAGSRFEQYIRTNAANFTWSVPAGTTITKEDGDYNITVTSGEQNDDASQTVRDNTASNTLRVVFADGFNDHATNYNTNRDKTIYVVDTYDGNAAILCITLDTPITRADGTTVKAGDVQEGDVLKGFNINGLGDDSDSNYYNWSTSELSSTSEGVTVTNVVYSFASRIYNINNGELEVTGDHPLLVKTSDNLYKFKPTLDLEVGEYLIKEDGSEVEITSINTTDTDVEVVSIDVETQDTYSINGYITHNKGANSYTLYVPQTPFNLSYTDPNLSWTGNSDQEDYRVQVDNNSDFSSPIIDYSNWNDTTMQVRLGDAPFNLTNGATYYARVAARDAGVLSPWSTAISFTA